MNPHFTDRDLIAYLCYTLTDARRAEMEQHLAACGDCRLRLNRQEALQRRIRQGVVAYRQTSLPANRLTFAQAAPHLLPTRARVRSAQQLQRLFSGGLALAALLALVILFIGMFSARQTITTLQPTRNAPTRPPTVVPTPAFSSLPTLELVWDRQITPARYLSPAGLTLDRQGNLYVVDAGNARILKYNRDGQFLTQWGSSGAGDGQFQFSSPGDSGFNRQYPFNSPGDIAVDRAGHVYVADTGNVRIQKFNRDGKFLTAWNGADSGQLKNPVALAIDSRNNVYVLDENGNKSQVRKFDGNGASLLSWSVRITDTEFLNPVDIGLDAQDRVYIINDVTNGLRIFDHTGKLTATWKIDCGSDVIVDLSVDASGNVYVGEAYSQVCKYSPDGRLLAEWTKPEVEFSGLRELTVDRQGSIYLSDARNSRVQKFRQP